ncbi:NAD(P)H-dependent oxidoreductase [Bacillus mycoides]|uniref:NAD(P)H-dependent oxidoreductase n=1 Tax=Bacillus mycoides TaxID=1405 RepID=UPI0010BEC1DD|nr:NAD(P)H-dependent oxidoreductase [Bacillus mycoides]TKI32715.1 NAD(P)H-dependent oxidoreductase [Bacillus mycoides]
MKTLIVLAHPSIATSFINKRWVEELKKYPEQYTVHNLYNVYHDGNIDIQKEQKLIEEHDNLVLQFPIQWFSCPPLLKKWLDDVFEHGWAYGSNGGDKLKDRKIALAVSAGIKKDDYSADGRYPTLQHLLSPFETTFSYCSANYRSFFAYYGKESKPGENDPSINDLSSRELDESARNYLKFIDHM